MPESFARSRTCTKCPDSLPGTAKLDECSSLLASRPCHFPCPQTYASSTPFFPSALRKEGKPWPRSKRVRVSFGVLSISQPVPRGSQGECPGFIGFYGCFLELGKAGVAANAYIQ